MKKFKVSFIGAGSVGFTAKLCMDILTVPEFRSIEIAPTDISEVNLDLIRQIIKRIVMANRLGARVNATTDRSARGIGY